MSFLDDLASYLAARFTLTVREHEAGGWEAFVRVDGEEPAALTRASTKARAVVMALAAELGRQVEDARPRFCSTCDDGESIRQRHAAAVRPFLEHQARADATLEGVPTCFGCVKRIAARGGLP